MSCPGHVDRFDRGDVGSDDRIVATYIGCVVAYVDVIDYSSCQLETPEAFRRSAYFRT